MNSIALDWIKKWAQYAPDKFFLREYDSGMEWTYSQFDQRISSIANYLQSNYGIKKGDRVVVLSKNRAETVFLFFSLMRLGAILVPLNFRLTPAELKGLLTDADPVAFIFEEEFSPTVSTLKPQFKKAIFENINFLSPFLHENPDKIDFLQNEELKFDDPVMILYTSGTTGVPKGAIITHRMLFWNSINTSLRLELNSSDHTQGFAPFFHTGGWNVLFTPFVHHGASHTLLKSFDPDTILKLMEAEKTTILFGVPTMLQMMSDSPLFDKTDLSSVRFAIVGGAPMPIPLIEKWHKKGIAIRQGYGLTEVGPNTFSLHQDDAIRKIGSIGFPNFYIKTKVMNENGEECPAGSTGELWLKSPVVTPGYWKNPEETLKSITDGWFHTGDMVQYDEEDYFYVVDRKKNMFISGGENVYPAEVEKVISGLSKIKEAAVIGVKDEKWGESGAAFLVKNKDTEFSSDDVLEHCRTQLAKFKIPKHLFFIEQLPRTETGKIDRKKLNELFIKLTP